MSTTVYHAVHPTEPREAKTTAAWMAAGFSRDGWRVTAQTGDIEAPLVFGEPGGWGDE